MVSFSRKNGVLELRGNVSKRELDLFSKDCAVDMENDVRELQWADVEFIPDGMFEDYNLESVCLTGGFIEIGTRAFAGCEKLAHIEFHATRTEIGHYAFTRCYSLEQVDLSRCLMHNGAFCGCSKLRTVKLPERHVILMPSVFAMTDVEEINTEGIDYVFGHAFAATRLLKSIRFYGHVVIEDHAFMSSEIQEVYLSKDTVVSRDAFEYCPKLKNGFVAYEHGWIEPDVLEDLDGYLGFPTKTTLIELF